MILILLLGNMAMAAYMLKELRKEDLRPEDRVLGMVPRELHVRHFPCVVTQDEKLAREALEKARATSF